MTCTVTEPAASSQSKDGRKLAEPKNLPITKKLFRKESLLKYAWSTGKGFFIGIINGLLGAGGGMLAIPILTKSGLNQTQAHATSVAIIFPLSIFSAILYLNAGRVVFQDVYYYLPWGIAGAFIGVWLLPKIPRKLLRKLFALITIFAGLRLLF